ncbi:YggS family pyridoxal phosphate-dependent enzyme [Streptococcus plurextorum]|uniref:YggS family pyridoxal phosphate-dependent enzyme n=1 Tax=Streptococcus plurextorum TaxID=456876 RepID=UPI000425FA6E|nr:YggS family pyridoxal phosphate-dependent enzyme [Streptococcus plurextorum]
MGFEHQVKKVFASVEAACHQANRSKEAVSIIAVTKYVDNNVASQLIEAGVRHIGENRVDQFLDKHNALSEKPVIWHLIGSLQRRKVKDVINRVDYFHALDSLSLANEIQKRALKTIKCFLQVNISGEESKHGFSVEELDHVLLELAHLDKIELVGLMTMAPLGADDQTLIDIFQKAKILQEQIQAKKIANMPFTELSMGMSGDYHLAIQEGATFVRIGTAFFE